MIAYVVLGLGLAMIVLVGVLANAQQRALPPAHDDEPSLDERRAELNRWNRGYVQTSYPWRIFTPAELVQRRGEPDERLSSLYGTPRDFELRVWQAGGFKSYLTDLSNSGRFDS